MTAPATMPFSVEAGMNVQPLIKAAQQAHRALVDITDYAKKNATLTLTAKLSGTSMEAMKKQVDAAVGGRNLPFTMTLDAASVTASVNALKKSLNGVVGLNLSSITAVQAQLNTQIQRMTALIAELRALGSAGNSGAGGRGGTGAGLSSNTRQLLADLEAANNAYKQGAIDASTYATRLAGLQSALRVAAAGAAQGATEFKALDRAVTQTVQGLRNVETANIVRLRTELAGARAQFDAAAAAATNLAQRRAAIAAYEGDLNRIRVALQGMATSGRLTAEQLGTVNRMLAQTAREANTIGGGVNLAGLSGNVRNAVTSLMQFNPVLGQTQAIFGNLPVPVMATVGAIGLLGAAFASSFRTAADFQQGMKDISALTQPAANDLAALKEAAQFGGNDLGVGPRDMAAALLELNKAGLPTADVLNGGAEATLNLAGAAGIAADQAGKLAVAAKTAFNLAAQDMPGIADTFANFANQTFLGAEDLSQAIAAVGPVAKSAGLSLNEFSGYMATLAQGGFKNMADAGTSLKTMLLSLQAPSETAARALNDLKLNVYDAAGNMRPMADVLGDLRAKLKGLTEQQRNQALKDIFGTDGIRAATILYEAGNEAIQKNIDSMGKQGEAARVAKERMDTFQGAMKQLNASWEAFKVTVGEKALPVMTDLVRGLKGGVDTLQDFANGTKNLVPYIAPLVGAFVALRGAAIAAAAPAIWTAITTAIGTFFTTVSAWVASNPLGALALAVSALAATVNKIMQDTARIYDEIDKSNQAAFDNTMKRVQQLRAENTELSRTQAAYLVALQTLQQAQEGDITGTDFWGNITRTQDMKKIEAAQQRVNELKGELVLLRTEAVRHNQLKTEVGGPGLAPEQVKKREEAIASLRKSLAERAFNLKLEGMSDLDRSIAQSREEYKKLKEELSKPFGGNTNNSTYQAALRELTTQQLAEEKTIRARFRKEEADARAKDAAEAARNARSYALETQRQEVAAMVEGRAKKQAERALDLKELEGAIREEADKYKKFPELKAQVLESGRERERVLRATWAAEDIKTAAENAQKVAEAEKSGRDALIAGIADETQRRATERDAQLADLQDSIRKQLAELEGYPAEQRRIEQAGHQQIQGLRQQWAAEDEREARERTQRLVKAWQDAQDAQAGAEQAARETDAARYELDLSRRLTAARGNALEVARIEAQAVQERARRAEQEAQAQYSAERIRLERARDEALRTDGLSADERRSIWRKYNSDVDALDSKYHADGLKRVQEREAAEVAAAEKIRQARIQQTVQPAEDVGRDLDRLRFAQGLTESTAERLALETQAQRYLERQASVYANLLSRAQEFNLTEEEKRKYADLIEKSNQGIQTSQKAQLDYQRQIKGEAREVVGLYGQLLTLTGTETGVAGAQRELADATAALGDAYAKALPFLEKYRAGNLKPEDFTEAKDALSGLVTALENQRQKLEVLRGEYTRQRDALASIQDVLKGFGQEFGNESLLNNAITFNQTTYDQAKTALEVLLKGGTYDAAQLAEATSKLQSAYGGLKDSVAALGEARAKEFEKEAARIKAESDRRTKLIDAQIKAAKDAGLDTSGLEQQRDAIVTSTERQVTALEARADKARKDAQAALSDRTSGIQELLRGVQEGAGKAQKSVDDLAVQVKKSEQEVQDSAKRMRSSLTGAFSGLPALAGVAGRNAGQQFMQQLQKQLKSAKFPGVTLPGTSASFRPATSSITQIITINGQNVTGTSSQSMKQLLKGLQAEAEAECRRRNT